MKTSYEERLQATGIQTSLSTGSQMGILSGLAWKASYRVKLTDIDLKDGSKKWVLQWLQNVSLSNIENVGYSSRFSHSLLACALNYIEEGRRLKQDTTHKLIKFQNFP